MGKHKNGKKRAKESQLAIRVTKDERDAFVRLCEDMDTTAAREIRRFMREFVAANSAAPVAADDGTKIIEAEVLAESAGASSELVSEATDEVVVAPPETAMQIENHEGNVPKRKRKK
jgi:hypothetical protein